MEDQRINELLAQYQQLNKELEKYKAQQANLSKGTTEWAKVNTTILQVKDSMYKVESEVSKLNDNQKQLNNTYEISKGNLQKLIVEMANLKAQGKGNSAEFQELAKRAGNMKDALDDTRNVVNAMSSDFVGLDFAVNSINNLSNAFIAYKGVAQLAGVSTETMEVTMQKIITVMGTMRAIQQVVTALKQRDSVVTVAQTIATKVQTIATNFATIATKSFGAALKSALPIVGLLSVAIGAITAIWKYFTSSVDSSNKVLKESKNTFDAQKEVHKDLGDAVDKNIDKYQSLTRSAVDNAQARIAEIERESGSLESIENQIAQIEEYYALQPSLLKNNKVYNDLLEARNGILEQQRIILKDKEAQDKQALENLKEQQKAVAELNKVVDNTNKIAREGNIEHLFYGDDSAWAQSMKFLRLQEELIEAQAKLILGEKEYTKVIGDKKPAMLLNSQLFFDTKENVQEMNDVLNDIKFNDFAPDVADAIMAVSRVNDALKSLGLEASDFLSKQFPGDLTIFGDGERQNQVLKDAQIHIDLQKKLVEEGRLEELAKYQIYTDTLESLVYASLNTNENAYSEFLSNIDKLTTKDNKLQIAKLKEFFAQQYTEAVANRDKYSQTIKNYIKQLSFYEIQSLENINTEINERYLQDIDNLSSALQIKIITQEQYNELFQKVNNRFFSSRIKNELNYIKNETEIQNRRNKDYIKTELDRLKIQQAQEEDYHATALRLINESGMETELKNREIELEEERHYNALIDLAEKFNAEADKLTEQKVEELDTIDKHLGYAKQLYDEFYNYLSSRREQDLQEELEALHEKDTNLKAAHTAKLLSEQQYTKEQIKLSNEIEAVERKQARERAISEKVQGTLSVLVSTASALMQSVAASPLTGGQPWFSWISALGATQLATTLAAPLPKASRGGLLQGASHAQGGIPIEAEGGEAIINKRSTAMFKPLLSAMNEAGGGVRFANGGVVKQSVQRMNNQAKTIGDIVSNQPIYVSVEEIRRVDSRYSDIIEQANTYR